MENYNLKNVVDVIYACKEELEGTLMELLQVQNSI